MNKNTLYIKMLGIIIKESIIMLCIYAITIYFVGEKIKYGLLILIYSGKGLYGFGLYSITLDDSQPEYNYYLRIAYITSAFNHGLFAMDFTNKLIIVVR